MSSKEPEALAEALLDHLANASDGDDVSMPLDMLESIVLKNNVCIKELLDYLHSSSHSMQVSKALTIRELSRRLN